VAGLEWKKAEFTLDGALDLTALQLFVEAHPRKDTTLLEITLSGTIDSETRTRLDAEILDKARDRFRYLRVRDEKLYTFLGAEDLASLPTDGWLGNAVARLSGEIEGTSVEERTRALRLLYRLYKGAS
jgi:hypothetical protein